jgi:hypothetical protein
MIEQYTESVKLSKIEVEIIREFRKVKTHGMGHLHVSVQNGLATGMHIQLTHDNEILRDLQRTN